MKKSLYAKLLCACMLMTLILLAGCSTRGNDYTAMQDMPCHQMPDGSWMGRCSEGALNQVDEDSPRTGGVVTDVLGSAKESSTEDLPEDSIYSLTADVVSFEGDGYDVVGYGYNKEIPGPLLLAQKDQKSVVEFTNNLDEPTTVHWHGLRHNIQDDGVPGVSQPPVHPGESYTYNLFFPDEGLFWFHPHIREDRQQDRGLAGFIRVGLSEYDEEYVVLDDVFIEQGQNFNYGLNHANFALMGRYGNTLLINGKDKFEATVDQGEITRFFFTNVANVRPFRIHFEDANMKHVGGDIGEFATQVEADHVIIAPAERISVDVQYLEPGTYEVIHESSDELEYVIGEVTVLASEDEPADFSLQTNDVVAAQVEAFKEYFDKEIDYTLTLSVEAGMMANAPCHQMGGVWMGDCDFDELEAQGKLGVHSEDEEGADGEDHGADGIEWEDEMAMMNLMSNSESVEWQLIDQEGNVNADIAMTAQVGDVIKIRLNNTMKSAHPMQHPIHLHGQRFLITSIDGQEPESFGWEDTVLVPTGAVVDILVDVTNPGQWMIHCHIAEHLEAGMMTSFTVEE
jgi:FtsP/CotA-like multicopper oxidase with cupredoxin domain